MTEIKFLQIALIIGVILTFLKIDVSNGVCCHGDCNGLISCCSQGDGCNIFCCNCDGGRCGNGAWGNDTIIEGRSKIQSRFSVMDNSHDGKVTEDEFKDYKIKVYGNNANDAKYMFKNFDQDGNGVITEDEIDKKPKN